MSNFLVSLAEEGLEREIVFTAATASNILFAATAPTLALGEVATTVYAGDPQFEYLGPRTLFDNGVLDYFIPSSNRNVVSMATAPLFVDTLLGHLSQERPANRYALHVLGDVPDTPARQEMSYFESVVGRQEVVVEGYDRGNHSSSNAFGVINLLSRGFDWIMRHVFRRKESFLKRELEHAAGGAENVLTPRRTIEGMYRMLHRDRVGATSLDDLNVRVRSGDSDGYVLENPHMSVPFDVDHQRHTFDAFWKPAASEEGEPRYWEALVNYDVADLSSSKRGKRAHPFYIQAAEQARFELADGSDVPVYSISLDTLDHDNLISVIPSVSEFQIRLIENFIDEKMRENPNARFKLSSHFPVTGFTGLMSIWNWRHRGALKQLLAREEVVLYTSAHTHDRKVHDLNDKLNLKREAPLMEVTVPSLVDYIPVQRAGTAEHEDARALTVEQMWVEQAGGAGAQLKIALQYHGLDQEDLGMSVTPEVIAALDLYKRTHGYSRARETIKDLRNKYIKMSFRNWWHRLTGDAVAVLNPRNSKRLKEYWGEKSLLQNISNHLTVVSVAQMFNEAEHLVPLLRSLLWFTARDHEAAAGDAAAQAQIASVMEAVGGITNELKALYPKRQQEFDEAFARGVRSSELRTFNDLFVETGVDQLAEVLLDLPMNSQARSFAVLAGLESSREEFEFHRGKPTEVPNQVPTIAIRLNPGGSTAVG